MENVNTNKRIEWIDIAKGLGIFVIASGHTLRGGFLYQICYSFSIPLFLLLSGFTFKKNFNNKEFIKKRAKRILIPYYCFSIINILVYSLINYLFPQLLGASNSDASFLSNIMSMLYANSRLFNTEWGRPLWFFPVFLVTEFCINFIEKNINNNQIIRIIFIFFNLLVSRVLPIESIYLPFQIENLFIFIFYIELGIEIKDVVEKIGHPLLLAIILFIFGIIGTNINGISDIRSLEFGKYYYLYVLVSLLFSFSIIYISRYISSSHQLEDIGKKSLEIICMHKYFIILFQRLVTPTKNVLFNSDFGIVSTLSGVLISILCVYLSKTLVDLVNRFFPCVFGHKKQELI